MVCRFPTAALRGRSWALLVLALFALGWLADRAHLALEPHRWCAEHARVEHAHVGSGAAASETARPRLVASDAGEHHACCLLLARGENPAGPVHPPAGSPAALDAALRVAPLPDAALPHAPVPLLLLAPKQSPPRA